MRWARKSSRSVRRRYLRGRSASITAGRVSVRTVTGKTRTLGPGDSFGEMALLDDEGRSATIRAETDITLETIAAWNFKSFLRDHPDVAYNLLKVLSRRVRQAES